MPDTETQKALAEKFVQQSDPPHILGDWLKTFYAENEAIYRALMAMAALTSQSCKRSCSSTPVSS